MFNPKSRRISLHDSLDTLATTRNTARQNHNLVSAQNTMQAAFPAANHTAAPSRVQILVAHDDELVRNLFGMLLESEGYNVCCANGANEALALLKCAVFDIMLCDIFLSVQNELELLPQAQAAYPDMPVILVTEYDNAEMARSALQQGASDFITMPLQPGELPIIIERNLTRQAVQRKSAQQQRQALIASNETTLDALMTALNTRDTEPEGHLERVTAYTIEIADLLNLPEAELYPIERGALLHDIGTIGVPDSILRKPGKLTPEEWVEMRKHPLIGYEMCARIDLLKTAATIVLHHHEAWDGSGYPYGLKGEAIPLGARIFAVADTLDAMTSDRPYRPAQSFDAARAEIEKFSGRQFDPHIVEIFLSVPEDRWQRVLTQTM